MASKNSYTEYVHAMQHRFHTLVNQDRHEHFQYHEGPNYMILEDLSNHLRKFECYTILWADRTGTPQGMIDMKWIRNPVPEALGGILETRVFVDPKYRKKGIARKLYVQALAFAKALQKKAEMQAGCECPVLLVEEILIPATGTHKKMREGFLRLLKSLDYTESTHKKDVFTLLLNPCVYHFA